MKLYKRILIFVFLAGINSGCFGVFICMEGSGHLSKQFFDLPNFNKIVVDVPSNIFLVQDSTKKFEIVTDDNLFNYIYVSAYNDILTIKSEKGICPRKLDIYITNPEFREIKVNGSTDIVAQSPIIGSNLTISINGSGDIVMDSIKMEKFYVKINGSGDVRIGGVAENFLVEITGSGDVRALKLKAKNVSVETNGSGDVYVNCLENLNVDISGSGDVYYIGNPKNTKINIYGSGSATKYEQKSTNR